MGEATRTVRPAELVDGDLIDLEDLPFFCDLDQATQMVAVSEYAVVGSEDGPTTVETPDCIVIHTDQGSFGVPTDLAIPVHGNINHI